MAREFARRVRSVNKHWTQFSTSSAPVAAGTLGILVSAAQHDRETLIRTRGNLIAFIDGVSDPGDFALISVGMIMVPEGTGTTVLWSPTEDGDAPWFWYEAFHLGYEEAVTNVVSYPGIGVFRQAIDSKAMRKSVNTEIQIVIENTSIGTALSVNLATAGRFFTQDT